MDADSETGQEEGFGSSPDRKESRYWSSVRDDLVWSASLTSSNLTCGSRRDFHFLLGNVGGRELHMGNNLRELQRNT